MNGKTRIARAMRHQPPDRVPVMCQLSLGHYLLNTRFSPHELWYTSEAFAEALVTLQRRYRFDGILVNVPGRPPNYLAGVQSIEKTDDGELVAWRNGDTTLMPWDDLPHHFRASDAQPDRVDFETFDPDHMENLDHYLGYLWNTYHIQTLPGKADGPLQSVPAYMFHTIDLVKAQAGREVSIHGEVFSPFTHFMELLGYEPALIALLMDPNKVHATLDRLAEAVVAWALGQVARGVDAILISSAFAGAPLLSRQFYTEFVLPYERRVTQAVRLAGCMVYTHTCGRIGDRLGLLEQTGTLGIDTLDPPPLGNGDLAVAKRNFGERLFFKGNLNSVSLLADQDEAPIIEAVAERLRIGKPGSGYILSTACSVAPRVEPWKLELMVPLAEQLGAY